MAAESHLPDRLLLIWLGQALPEHTKLGVGSLCARPPADVVQIHRLRAGDQDGLLKSLSIIPVVKRSQAILHAIRGREQAQCAKGRSSLSRSDNALVADHQWACRELDHPPCLRMSEVSVALDKAESGKRISQLTPGKEAFLDEVQVVRDVLALRPDLHAGAAGQRDRHAGSRQGLADQRGQFLTLSWLIGFIAVYLYGGDASV